MWNMTNALFRTGLLLLLTILVPGTGSAETTLTPNVTARTEFNDNILFAVENPKADLVSSLGAGLDWKYRTERFQSNTGLHLKALKYLEASDRDREEVHLDSSMSHTATERLSILGSVSYRQDSSLETELQETGMVTVSKNRVRTSLGCGFSWNLSELQVLKTYLSLGSTRYESDTQVDYDTTSLSITWNRTLTSMPGAITVQPYWNRQASEVSEVETLGLLVGWTHMLTENWSLNAHVGARKTDSQYSYRGYEMVFVPRLLPAYPYRIEEVTYTDEESSWGGLADVSLNWTGEVWSFGSSYNRDLSYSSQGEPIERDKLNLTVKKSLDERLTVRCGGAVTLSRYEREDEDESYRQLSLSPAVIYLLTKDHRLSAGMNFDYYEADQTEASKRDRRRIWISLDCRFPQVW